MARPTAPSLLLALLLAACVPPGKAPAAATPTRKPAIAASPKATARPSAAPSATATAPRLLGRVLAAGAALIADARGQVLSDQGGGFISDQGGGILGNNAGSYGLLALAAGGVGGAVVQQLDAAGQPVGEPAITGGDGGFDLLAVGGATQVRATFGTAGKAFTWKSVLDGGAATLDEASTLAAERGGAAPAALAGLATALRAELGPDVLPYMANDSGDRLAALDQLLLDRATLRAAVDPALATPAAGWAVDTPIARAVLKDALAERLEEQAGVRAFLPDPVAGVVITFPGSATKGQRLVLLKADAKPALVAQLPPEVGVPIRLARGADGKIRVVARLRDAAEVKTWVVAADGTVAAQPGVLATVAAAEDRDLGQVAVDAQGRVYLADTRADVVRRLGPADAASVAIGEGVLKGPEGVAIAPDGTLYVADTGHHALRRVAPDGTVTLAAGDPAEAAYRNGRGLAARLGSPEALAFGPGGDVFMIDRDARRVRRLSKDGSVFLVAGTGEEGEADGAGPGATFRQPSQLALGPDGALYLRDSVGPDRELVIRRISRRP